MMRRAFRSAAAFALTVLLAGCNKPEAPSNPPPAITNAAPKTAEPPQPQLPETIATIQGSSELPVRAPQAGYLVRQVYREGAMVAAGDVLFLLDPRASHPDTSSGGANNPAIVKVIATGLGVPTHALHGAGDHVEDGDELTTIAQIDNVVAEVTVSDVLARNFTGYRNSPATASEQPAIELILPDGSIYPTNGVVDHITTSGSVNTMQIDFPNPTHVLQPGQFVKVRSAAP